MADVTAEYEELLRVAGTVEAGSAGIGDERARLLAAARDLGGRWTGAAQRAFGGAHGAWDGEMAHLEQVLAAAADAVRTSSAAYRRADEAVARAWSL
ncbi:WXG100 family type VII secretion target [Cellulomonas sp. JZ18]|uniref:WXG100 family type VII secretion target n=1 Tax=Cellulomonas sp. JZ18 TaxID=2654191 RepID=UPI0012D49010|nr:WXG100 family type VII secretion target [Cellulomonas sp. JZ18]QGQ19851.1 WXG100 family type VII secretion target [Cellulomonas sp. JZ18]